LVTVPATTGPKSHETGPEVLLMELAVCAEAICARLKIKTIASRPTHGLEGFGSVILSLFLDSESEAGAEDEGSVDMVSPEE